MKSIFIYMSVFLLLTSLPIYSKLYHSEISVSQFLEIFENSKGSGKMREYYQNQLSNMEHRVAGIFFSMKQETFIRIRANKNLALCITKNYPDVDKIFNEIVKLVSQDSDLVYLELDFTSAVRKVIFNQNRCS